MKISYSYFKRTCLFLALFSWLLPMNLFADVTAEWGDWGSPVTHFPSNTSSTINGDINITLTSNITSESAWLGCNSIPGTHDCYWIGDGSYIDITFSSGLLSGVSACVWDNGGGLPVKIQFCWVCIYY